MGTPLASAGRSYALLADGSTMTIRPAVPGDYAAVKRMHEDMSTDNRYMRFFNVSPVAAEREAGRVCREPGPDHAALLGLQGDELVGVASYELIPGEEDSAEIAFAVADDMHGRGIATLLLEHLVSLADGRGVKALTAEALPENSPVLQVLTTAGLSVRRRAGSGMIEFTMPVPHGAALGGASPYLDAVDSREQQAGTASLEPLLAPRSVAVVGAVGRPGSTAWTILRNIREAGYTGTLQAVDPQAGPQAGDAAGISCVASAGELAEAPDLAVVAVPAVRAVAVAQELGERGARSLLVISDGLTPAQESALLAASRQAGVRLAGPGSFGIAVPGIGLNATSIAHHPAPGKTGLAVQSGGLGAVLAEHLSRLGIGISSLAALGDKLDVSGSDMLIWWEADQTTRLAVLYLESFGNPRRFARTARRVSAKIPVLTVHAGRSFPGQRAAASHTAAAAAPLITRQALFDQAGIIATAGFSELLDVAALVASQPVPAGSRVAIVSNGGGAGVLAADACAEAGLIIAPPGLDARTRLRDVLPVGSALGGPVDTTAAVTEPAFREAMRIVASEDGVHALLALVVRNGPADLVPALTAGPLPVPLAAVVLDQPESVRLLPGGGPGRAVPAYGSPEGAARALARAARYGAWRAQPSGTVPGIGDLQVPQAHAIVDAFLARMPGGGWLSAAEADDLLRCYGIPMVPFRRAASADEAVEEADRLGGHVVIKADVPGLLHKHDAGGVELDLHGADEVRAAMCRLADRFAGRLAGVLVEPMITGGTEIVISVVQEPVFGPVVVFGLAGVATDILDDRVARLAPLTDSDADDLIHSIRAAPLLLGQGGPAAVDIDALRDTLLRVSQLTDDLPQIAQLDLNPVIARPDGVIGVDTRIRATSRRPADPFLRQLPPDQREAQLAAG